MISKILDIVTIAVLITVPVKIYADYREFKRETLVWSEEHKELSRRINEHAREWKEFKKAYIKEE